MADPSQLKHYTESNRAAWNEVMPLHRQAAKDRLDQLFSQPGAVHLDQVEIELLEQFGLQGKNVAHLCCNNGIELLSLKNLGAGECVGFDISDEAIQEANERAAHCRIDCRYIRSDVYEIDPSFDNRFDIVYISIGCLGWMPDLKLFLARAVALLRTGGLVFIHEQHPFVEMLPADDFPGEDILRLVEPYFKTDPYVDYGGLDYLGNTPYQSDKPQYWFVHKLADIFMALIENGIAIQHFSEYEKDISAGHARIEAAHAGVPLSCILIGSKQHPG